MHFGYLSSDGYTWASIIIVAAFAIRGMLGFGSGLISVSFLIFFLPIKLVVPIVFMLDAVASLALGSYDYKQIRWKDMPWLWAFTIVGLIVGAWVLKTLPAQSVTVLLGIFILIYVGYALIAKPERLPLVSRIWGAPLGFMAGLIGSLYGGGGPSIVAYFQMRHLGKRAFRASFQFIAVTDAVIRGALYFLLGLLGSRSAITSAWLLPWMAVGLVSGNFIHFRIDARRFQIVVLLVLAFAGIRLVLP